MTKIDDMKLSNRLSIHSLTFCKYSFLDLDPANTKFPGDTASFFSPTISRKRMWSEYRAMSCDEKMGGGGPYVAFPFCDVFFSLKIADMEPSDYPSFNNCFIILCL